MERSKSLLGTVILDRPKLGTVILDCPKLWLWTVILNCKKLQFKNLFDSIWKEVYAPPKKKLPFLLIYLFIFFGPKETS